MKDRRYYIINYHYGVLSCLTLHIRRDAETRILGADIDIVLCICITCMMYRSIEDDTYNYDM